MPVFFPKRERVGVISNIKQDPYDPDFLLVEIYTASLDSKHTHRDTKTAMVAAGQAERENLRTGLPITWNLIGENIREITNDELERIKVDKSNLLRQYNGWLKAHK